MALGKGVLDVTRAGGRGGGGKGGTTRVDESEQPQTMDTI